jgi:hypothetical protein
VSYNQRRREYWHSPEFKRRNIKLFLTGLFFAIATSVVVVYFYMSGRLEIALDQTTNTLITRSVLLLFGYSAAVVLVLVLFNAFAVPALRRSRPGS